jgi:hypothetical protein
MAEPQEPQKRERSGTGAWQVGQVVMGDGGEP